MVWNLLLDDLSPVLPMLRYQFLNRRHESMSQSKATNIYFFTGLTVGGFALDFSIQSHALLASFANLVYWGAFTAGLSGFAERNHAHDDLQVKLHASLPPPETVPAPPNPVINIQYRKHDG